jgi:hypothetical protein
VGAREPRRADGPAAGRRRDTASPRGGAAWSDPRSAAPGLALARCAGAALALLAVPVVGAVALVAGAAGARGAIVGLALVGVLFGAAALLHAWAARLSPTTQVAVLATGVGARLLGYLLAVESLRGVDGLHRPSLAIATAVALAVTLGCELWLVSRTPAFFWVQPDPGRR